MSKKKYFGDLPKNNKYNRKNVAVTSEARSEDVKQELLKIPTPMELAEYDAVFEGGASRIIKLIENEQIQKQALENKAIKMQWYGRLTGQFLFCLTIIILAHLSANLYQSGYGLMAIIIMLAGCATLIYAIFHNTRPSNLHFKKGRK